MFYETVTLLVLAAFCRATAYSALIDGDNMLAHLWDDEDNFVGTVRLA